MKHHTHRPVSGEGRLEYPVENAAVKVQVRVQGRPEAVNEDHRPQACRGATAGTVFA